MATAYERAIFVHGEGALAAATRVAGSLSQVVAVDLSGGGSTEQPLAGRDVGSGWSAFGDPRLDVVRVVTSATPAATSHVAGDAVGGALTFASAVRGVGGSGVVCEVMVTDTADAPTKFAGYLALFRQAPTASDDSPFSPADFQARDCLGVVTWAAADWTEWGDNAVLRLPVVLPVVAAASSSVFGVLVTSETKTFAASALHVGLVVGRELASGGAPAVPDPGSTVPDAPTVGTASVSGSSVSVTFSAPGNTGGEPITGYTAVLYDSAGTNPVSPARSATVGGSATSATILDVPNGTYRVRVKATNGVGDSAVSAASGQVTVRTASGGTVTDIGTHIVHTFTTVGTSTFTPNGSVEVEVLVVAGGGGGGGGASPGDAGGGGGAGAMRTGTYTVSAAQTVTVGNGGTAGTTSSSGGDGGNSSFGSLLTSVGGGGGARNGVGRTGGSGGGGTSIYAGGSGSTGGNNGGSGGGSSNPGGGGGGGAGSAGSNGSSPTGGAGGSGTASSITGSSVTYAVGGKGGDWKSTGGSVGADGTANRGNGGGGGDTYKAGGAGGSGIVVVRYPKP